MFCHIFEKYQGYFFAKKGGGGCFCQIRKLPGYFFKVEGVGGGERHDFRKPIICAIKKSLNKREVFAVWDRVDVMLVVLIELRELKGSVWESR